jgi:SH3-like domain-containing protein
MLGISVFLAALFLFSVAEESWMIHGSKSGVVVSKDVVARKGDSETYEPSFIESLHAGTEFDVVEQRPDWYRVELADGRSCWIPVKSVELVR